MLGDAGDQVGALNAQSPPSADEVRAQLDRLACSRAFSVSARHGNFLRYVVEETLAGRGDRIKAYSIATEVFGRDHTFDSQNDPVVRIEAGRLRRALERYYLLAGRSDPIVIDVPKGAYVPTFTRPSAGTALPDDNQHPDRTAKPIRSSGPERALWLAYGIVCGLLLFVVALASGRFIASSLPANPSEGAGTVRPLVVVVPFADLGEGLTSRLYATGLSEDILSQIARFSELSVLGPDTSNSLGPSVDLGRLRREFGIRYAIEGSVRASGARLRVTARLVDAHIGTVLWSQAYDESLERRDFLAIQGDIAEKVATTLGQLSGVIFRADEGPSEPRDPEAYACTSQYYVYRALRDPQRHAAVRTCLERTVARFPTYVTGLALLSLLYLDEDRFGFNPKGDLTTAMARAVDAARRAVSLNPYNVRALQALMITLYLNGDHDEALRLGEQAMAVNPNDTDLLGDLGMAVAFAGDWKRGATLVERARTLNPAHAGFYNGTLALCAYMQGDYPAAAALLHVATPDKYPLYHLVAAIIHAQLGLRQQAEEERAIFARERPDFIRNWDREWSRRLRRVEDRAHAYDGARKAGFIASQEPPVGPLSPASAGRSTERLQ